MSQVFFLSVRECDPRASGAPWVWVLVVLSRVGCGTTAPVRCVCVLGVVTRVCGASYGVRGMRTGVQPYMADNACEPEAEACWQREVNSFLNRLEDIIYM